MKFRQLVWVLIICISMAIIIVHELSLYKEPNLLLISLLIFSTYVIVSFISERKNFVEYAVMLLMLLVGIITYLFELHVEGSLVLALFALAEILEEYVEERAEKELYALMEYMPKKAKLMINDRIVEVEVKEVKAGNIVLVGRGDRVPVDGVVIEGIGEVNQSVITGEPLPITVKQHSFVYAGSLVVEGVLKIKTLASGDSSLFSRLVTLVEKYKKRRTKIEKLIHRFSKIYLPLMLVFAIFAWFLIDIKVALVIIAVACPSAFLVAVPATFLYSLAGLARRGVLLKGTFPLEKAAKIGVIAFDKTGTLTLGKPRVEKVVVYKKGLSQLDILRLAASIEVTSSHPLARAIVERAQSEGIKLFTFRDVKEQPGMGVIGRVDSYRVAVGNEDLMKEIGIEIRGKDISRSPSVYVASNDEIVGLISFSDEINPKSKLVVDELKKMGYEIVMLTGDKKENAERIASILGIDEVYAELSPEEKVKLIDELRKRYKKLVAMIGDGINDAPALAVADLGIAVGSIQAAIEAGDIALTSGSLENIQYLFKVSQETAKKALENIVMILTAKIAVIILSILGLIPLWAAVAIGDDGALLAILANIFFMKQIIQANFH